MGCSIITTGIDGYREKTLNDGNNMVVDKSIIKYKKIARECALKALYNYLFNDYKDKEKFIENFYKYLATDLEDISKIYFEKIFYGTINKLEKIKGYIDSYYKGNFDNLNIIEKAIIYFSIHQMIYMDEDKKLVISESLRISDKFIGKLFSKKLNAFLDKVEK